MRLPFVRFLGPFASILGLLALAYFGVTKGFEFAALDELAQTTESREGAADTSLVGIRQAPDRIRIASFNIQVFGEKKSSDANVMKVLAHLFQQFDLIAVQEMEIRSPHVRPIDKLISLINQAGWQYEATLSPSLGRTSQTEQYAYVWNTERIELVPQSAYVVEDGRDLMHREPLVASFQTIVPADPRGEPFRFTLINVHTDPDEVSGPGPDNELNILDDVFLSVREYEYAIRGEDDILLLGDLNVNEADLAELGSVPGIMTVAGDTPTNTAGTKIYDHILLDQTMTREFTGRAGVVEFVKHLGLTPEQAAAVSDHRPVWAEFSAYEGSAAASLASTSTAAPQ
jgi:endonuclease/exonuclease/phosphatase family metal-dependent hydrolase